MLESDIYPAGQEGIAGSNTNTPKPQRQHRDLLAHLVRQRERKGKSTIRKNNSAIEPVSHVAEQQSSPGGIEDERGL